MSVTSGFFNSINGDRRYNAEQMSSIFDGIINDGIFANIGTAFMVEAKSGNDITVGIGRAWFNSTWIYNDAILPLTAEDSDILLNRYDAVVIEIDRSVAGRIGDIKIIKGTAATDALYPALVKTNEIHQYPLAYIYRPADSSEIKQANITNAVGTSSAPYITGILQVQNIDNIVAQWQAEFYDWNTEKQSEFEEWFELIKDQLGEDLAGSLQNQINDIIESMRTRYITLTASGWSDTYPYEQTVEVEGITSDDSLMVIGAVHVNGNTEAQDKAIDKAAGMLMYYEDGVKAGSVTFRAKKKPAVDFTVITKGG